MLWTYQRVFFGATDKPANLSLKDLNAREIVTLAPLVILILAIGWYPAPLLARIEPAVQALLALFPLAARQARQISRSLSGLPSKEYLDGWHRPEYRQRAITDHRPLALACWSWTADAPGAWRPQGLAGLPGARRPAGGPGLTRRAGHRPAGVLTA
jgi:hypothetical protein